jgi:DNA-binding NarL/FixJ family response regulator
MKILLAEDEPVTRELIKTQLQQWQYDVVCASNGAEAWALLQGESAPKLALLDWKMPEMTGLEVCQQLRSVSSGTYVYVILLTSLSEKTYVVQGLEAGADDYITKPCNQNELRLRLLTGQRILNLESELLMALKQNEEYSNNAPPSTAYMSKLIGRELEILRLVAANKTREEIANTFHLSPDWVSAHLSNIMHKMGVKTIEEAARRVKDQVIL